MRDIISRQAAIDALKGLEFCHYMEFGEYIGEDTREVRLIRAEKARDALLKLPSAQPERKKGKWIYGEDEYGIDGYHCDKCGFFVPWNYAHTFINYIKDYNFCPNCGADMRGGENEQN